MALAAGHDWSQSMALSQHNADEVSSIFPDRPIRPLPKRKIRSRLSSDQAGAISYPPALSSSSSLFGSPQSQNGHTSIHINTSSSSQLANGNDGRTCECGGDHGTDLDSEEEEGLRLRSYGYESFENTNNKKKRKIPVSAGGMVIPAANTQSQTDSLSADHSISSLSGPIISRSNHTSLSPAMGFPSTGRARPMKQQTRSGLDRRPLGTSSNAQNINVADESTTTRRDWMPTASYKETDERIRKGIEPAKAAETTQQTSASISAAGQENVGYAQTQHTVPTQGKDFTFECKSTTSNKMAFAQRPNTDRLLSGGQVSENVRSHATQGTQTHSLNSGLAAGTLSKRADRAQLAAPPRMGIPGKQASIKPRKPDQEYATAARQRQMQQDLNNYHHPPRKEDIWICEFCEYEAIWGRPPVALVRQYEIKDHKERKVAEERRRLLDKAKAKGRKNKKSGRGLKAGGPSGTQTGHEYDAHYDNHARQEQDSQGEEFFDDEYEGESHIHGLPTQYDDPGYEETSYTSPSGANGG